MTTHKATPALLTVQEAAQLLRLSADTVRRQIKEGSLQALPVRTTPTGRAQYRIPSEAILKLLGQDMPDDPLEPLREAFAALNEQTRKPCSKKWCSGPEHAPLRPQRSGSPL